MTQHRRRGISGLTHTHVSPQPPSHESTSEVSQASAQENDIGIEPGIIQPSSDGVVRSSKLNGRVSYQPLLSPAQRPRSAPVRNLQIERSDKVSSPGAMLRKDGRIASSVDSLHSGLLRSSEESSVNRTGPGISDEAFEELSRVVQSGQLKVRLVQPEHKPEELNV